MAKRRCPFEYDLSPQMKIHVSDKEIARAGSQENMSSIYEKTLRTLMAGSKASSLSKKNSSRDTESGLDLCGCCQVIDSTKPSRCCYCDTVMCFSCLLQCAECCGMFCTSCSLVLYEKEEQNMCISCYK